MFGKFNVGGALRELGINTETISEGANVEALLPFTDLTPRQAAKVEAIVDHVYQGFLDQVLHIAKC